MADENKRRFAWTAARKKLVTRTVPGLAAQAAGAGCGLAAVWLLAGFAWALLTAGVLFVAWGVLHEGELI